MKGLMLACLICGLIQSPGGVDPKGLVGTWQGEGRYLDGELDRARGPVPFLVRVDGAFQGEGTVGDARLREWRLERRGQLLRIEARLEGRIRMDAPFEKDHLVLQVEDLRVNQFTAEFQVRSDEAFDPSPEEGRVTFTRLRPLSDPAKP